MAKINLHGNLNHRIRKDFGNGDGASGLSQERSTLDLSLLQLEAAISSRTPHNDAIYWRFRKFCHEAATAENRPYGRSRIFYQLRNGCDDIDECLEQPAAHVHD